MEMRSISEVGKRRGQIITKLNKGLRCNGQEMKIKLRNFRCHTNAQYELPDSGLILLSGSSGSGKSTLLKGILYALFGSIAVRKPYSFGVTTCSVTLEFMGMKICRTNRPNRVVVNDDLEDAAAQAYIDEKLGVGYDEFMVSSYIPQKNNNSVLSLSQSEQLRMIKTLAFEGSQNEIHKEKLKEMIRDSSAALVEKRTEAQFSQREVDRIRELLVPLEFPLVVGEEETEETTVKSYRRRMRTFNKRMETLLERKAAFNDDFQSNIYAREKLDMTNEKIDGINTHLTRISARHQQLDVLLKDVPEDLQTQVEHVDLAIQFIELKDEFTKLKTHFEQIRQDEVHERETQKALLEHELWKRGFAPADDEARGACLWSSGDGSDVPDVFDLETATEELERYQVQLILWKQYQRACEELRTLREELEGSASVACGLTRTPQLDHTDREEMVDYYTEIIKRTTKEKADLYRQKEQLAGAAKKLALEKEIVYCPECKVPLRWRDNVLVSVHDHQPVEERNYTTEIKKVEKQLLKVHNTKVNHEQILERIRKVVFPVIQKTDLQVYKQMKSQVKMLTTFITQNKQREEELARIERESVSDHLTPALKGLRQQLDEKEHEMNELLEAIDTVPTEELAILRDQLQKLNSQVEHYQAHTEEMVQVSAELKELRQKHKHLSTQIQTLKQQVAGVNVKTIQKKITSINRDITRAKKKQAKDEELSSAVDQYLVYCEQQKELDRWEEQLAEITKQSKSAERIHTANLTLKDKYVQAEIVALESTIMSINEHTRYYLDTFFADHQLSAALESAHKGKKIQTLKINTAINYKGNEYDNISQMSGGEFDRCTLASICGINSMLGSPILVLDESLASLDTDTNTEIIRFLSELAEDKLIIVCSHEAVRGIFDDILEM